jgi:hypothetical protein
VRRAAAAVSAISIVSALALGGVAGAAGDKPLTKKQFIKQADKYCAAGNDALGVLGQTYFAGLGKNEQPDPATIAAFWVGARPILEAEISDIRALAEPKADAKTVKKILSAVQDAVDGIDADPQTAFTGNPFAKADRLARRYGLKVCGASN